MFILEIPSVIPMRFNALQKEALTGSKQLLVASMLYSYYTVLMFNSAASHN